MTTGTDIARTQQMRLVVIESPCAPLPGRTFEHNANYLRRCLRDSIERGEAPIASHGLFAFSNVFDDANALERKQCMLAGWAWMYSASEVIVYADHGITQGMIDGIAFAQNLGVSVSYRYLDAHTGHDKGTYSTPLAGTPYHTRDEGPEAPQ